MASDVKGRRPYRSRRRREQASATRSAILEAAGELFQERGYSGTTIEAIAAAAGVATITVYAAFGSKRALLARLVEVSLVGDEEPVPLLEREGPRAVMREPDQGRQIAMFAEDMGEIMERVGPLFEVMGHASPTEPEIAELLERLLRQRLDGMRVFVRALARNGALRAGLSREAAAQTVWAITSPQLHRLVTQRLGWSRRHYSEWLSKTLSATLLPEGAGAT